MPARARPGLLGGCGLPLTTASMTKTQTEPVHHRRVIDWTKTARLTFGRRKLLAQPLVPRSRPSRLGRRFAPTPPRHTSKYATLALWPNLQDMCVGSAQHLAQLLCACEEPGLELDTIGCDHVTASLQGAAGCRWAALSRFSSSTHFLSLMPVRTAFERISFRIPS